MFVCYKCGNPSYIKYGKHFVCPKHYNLEINEVFEKIVKKIKQGE